MNYKNPFCVGALCITVLVFIYLLFVPAMRVYGEDCVDMMKVSNKLLSMQAEDSLNDLKEELMNLRHRDQIPYQFNAMSKHEYRYFLRGQIYATCRFIEMVEMQHIQAFYGD